MLRTTKKEVKEKIRAYILDCIDLSEYEEYSESTSDRDSIIGLYNIFYDEKSIEIKREGEKNTFKNWLQGLPTAFNIDYETNTIKTILIYWLQATEKEVEKYNNVESYNLFLYLITREFFAMHKQALK